MVADAGAGGLEIDHSRAEAVVGEDEFTGVKEEGIQAAGAHVGRGEGAGEALAEAHDQIEGAGGAFPDEFDAVEDLLEFIEHDGERGDHSRLVGCGEEVAHGGEVAAADLLEGDAASLRPAGGLARGGDEQVGHPLHGGKDHRNPASGRGFRSDGGHGPNAGAVGH